MTPPPYFAQWESDRRVAQFLAGHDAATDPRWAASGAETPAEYARWAGHLCGIACLRMALAARGHHHRTHDLRRGIQALGGYVEEGGAIHGLRYAGAVAWLQAHGLPARIVLEEDVLPATGQHYIASVHPLIRAPAATPPHTGGHLVLVFGQDAAGRLRFHNPSGHNAATRRDVRMDAATFSRFHARRGILLG